MLKKIVLTSIILGSSTLFGMSLTQLNSATKTELMEINGIGDAKADAIIKERKKGKFKSFEDLQRVEGIGEQTAANVKNDVKSKAEVKKVKKTKAAKKTKSETAEKKERKIKSMDEKKKELKTKEKKTKKTKSKKEKESKNKN